MFEHPNCIRTAGINDVSLQLIACPHQVGNETLETLASDIGIERGSECFIKNHEQPEATSDVYVNIVQCNAIKIG